MKIIVTGSNGMVGSCIKNIAYQYPEHEFIFTHRSGGAYSVDLTHKSSVDTFFSNHRFDYIIHLAANVGGLYKNMSNNIDMFQDNINITMNVLHACKNNGINRGIFCLSSCIYPFKPKHFPMDESMIHDGPAHPTNEGYAYAKRMMEMLCRQYNNAFGTQYICVIPVNLYGPYDNFSLKDGHFIPMLMHRFHVNRDNPIAYGSGKPLRQFLFAPDFAQIICDILLSENHDISSSVICCNDEEYTIEQIVHKVAYTMNIDKQIISWDASYSDGCLQKTVTNNLFKKYFPNYKFTSIEDGLNQTHSWFQNNYFRL